VQRRRGPPPLRPPAGSTRPPDGPARPSARERSPTDRRQAWSPGPSNRLSPPGPPPAPPGGPGPGRRTAGGRAPTRPDHRGHPGGLAGGGLGQQDVGDQVEEGLGAVHRLKTALVEISNLHQHQRHRPATGGEGHPHRLRAHRALPPPRAGPPSGAARGPCHLALQELRHLPLQVTPVRTHPAPQEQTAEPGGAGCLVSR